MSSQKSKPVVLIVEGEPIIAMGLEMDLEGRYDVAGPFATCADTLGWLQVGAPDLAIIDFEVRDDTSEQIAVALSERSIPFIVFSAFSSDEIGIPALRGVPWIEKPTPGTEILHVLAALQAGGKLAHDPSVRHRPSLFPTSAAVREANTDDAAVEVLKRDAKH